ncbi:MAG: hypothetical protein OEY14_12440, partial [Myxococcales bacterium]|nr:hypothetical protein [Myxococcales bacterium]
MTTCKSKGILRAGLGALGIGGVLLMSSALSAGCSLIVDGILEDKSDGGVEIPDVCLGVANGELCEGADAGRSICLSGLCVPSSCGDGFVDLSGGEDCEDGNDVSADGCEPGDCTLTCRLDADCQDGNSCNGPERCMGAICVPTTPLDDGVACTRSGSLPDSDVCR